jgi:hypothetical protein
MGASGTHVRQDVGIFKGPPGTTRVEAGMSLASGNEKCSVPQAVQPDGSPGGASTCDEQ